MGYVIRNATHSGKHATEEYFDSRGRLLKRGRVFPEASGGRQSGPLSRGVGMPIFRRKAR